MNEEAEYPTILAVKTREEMMAGLRQHIRLRLDAQYPRTKRGEYSKAANRAGLEMLCGAAAVVDALGLGESRGLTASALLVSCRGIDEFLNPKKEG